MNIKGSTAPAVYGETLDLDSVPGSRTWTLSLLVFGISANLYVACRPWPSCAAPGPTP